MGASSLSSFEVFPSIYSNVLTKSSLKPLPPNPKRKYACSYWLKPIEKMPTSNWTGSIEIESWDEGNIINGDGCVRDGDIQIAYKKITDSSFSS